jgi:hypothetical protein
MTVIFINKTNILDIIHCIGVSKDIPETKSVSVIRRNGSPPGPMEGQLMLITGPEKWTQVLKHSIWKNPRQWIMSKITTTLSATQLKTFGLSVYYVFHPVINCWPQTDMTSLLWSNPKQRMFNVTLKNLYYTYLHLTLMYAMNSYSA